MFRCPAGLFSVSIARWHAIRLEGFGYTMRKKVFFDLRMVSSQGIWKIPNAFLAWVFCMQTARAESGWAKTIEFGSTSTESRECSGLTTGFRLVRFLRFTWIRHIMYGLVEKAA